MSQKYPSVLLFGAPGVGKGTQGAILGRVPGFFHMSTGDMFRSLDRESEIGRIFDGYSRRGELVPDEVTVRVWRDYMQTHYDGLDENPIVLLDGIPRNPAQAGLMDGVIDVRLVLHLVAPDVDVLVERLRRRALEQGRPDDADEGVIRRRYEVYQQETSPVLSHYPRELVREIDALESPLRVLCELARVLDPIVGARRSPARASRQ